MVAGKIRKVKADGVKRCFMRYGNQGQLYRVCSEGGDKSKPPAVFTPLITPQQFILDLAKKNKKIKGYADLTSSQQQNYHRLDMANRREERAKNKDMNNKVYSLYLEQKRADAKLDRLEDQVRARQEKKQQKIVNRFERKGTTASSPQDIKDYFKIKQEKEIKRTLGKDNKEAYINRIEDKLKSDKNDIMKFEVAEFKEKRNELLKEAKENKRPLSQATQKSLKREQEIIESKLKNIKDKLDSNFAEKEWERVKGKFVQNINEKYGVREKKAQIKLELAIKDAKAQGKGPQWIKKNVLLIFDKNQQGKATTDLKELMMANQDDVEDVEELQAELDQLQEEGITNKKVRKKKLKNLTQKQIEAQEKKEAKELKKLKYELSKINKKYK